ncbi:MAG: sulfatase-like hydrolase/transferase [Planctomycetota bacterium]|nr:sulfatase-like hydrolase/transferase [Planctomycetota bacterium]
MFPDEHGTNRSHPNVLFIAFDDLNDWVQDLGGHPQTITPNLQRLSRRGMRFTNARCAAPVCNPSRTAIMTGLRPSTTGVYMNRDSWRSLSGKVEWMNLHFRAHGYRVGGGGKIFHGGHYIAEDWDASLDKPTKGLPTPVAAEATH